MRTHTKCNSKDICDDGFMEPLPEPVILGPFMVKGGLSLCLTIFHTSTAEACCLVCWLMPSPKPHGGHQI